MTLFNCFVRHHLRFFLRAALICLLAGGITYAQQNVTKQQADHFFYAQSYAQAIAGYTELLNDNSQSSEQRKSILFNLAYAYKEVGDFPKAENMYRQLIALGEPTGPYKVAYLYYAQVLGKDGQIQEAQAMFDRYQSVKSAEDTQPGMGIPVVEKNNIIYRVETLGINTPNAEFSPAYFREGLVYVAGKGSSGTSTSTGKGYLNLYYVPFRTDLTATGVYDIVDGVTPVDKFPASANLTNVRVGRDSYTRPTANDSRTIGSFTPFVFSEGLSLEASVAAKSQRNSSREFSSEINSKYHEGPVTFSADGSTIIFTRNNFLEGRSGKSSDNINKLKLYTAQLQDGGWANVEELPFNSDEYSTGHPSLSRDGKVLYFASDRPGGQGGTDLYVVRWQNDRWSEPTNLGPRINTSANEMFPFADENGNLYFASDGYENSLGGLDLYYANMNGRAVPRVFHLDAPLNSSADDFGIISDANRSTGYFSSNRLDGNDDIFRFTRETSLYGCRNLSLRVFEEGSDVPISNATVSVKARGEGKDEQILFTNSEGVINICLDGNNDFVFELSKDEYINSTLGFSTLSLSDDKPTRLGMSMLKLPPAPDSLTLTNNWENDPNVAIPTLRGTVTSEGTNKPIEGVKIILQNECDEKTRQTVTGPDGRYEFELAEGCAYTLVASKPSYGTNKNSITRIPPASTPKVVSANLKMLKAGDYLELDDINYDTGKWEVRKDAARELDKMVATMRKYPTMKIEIGSHTDSQGNAQFNQYLSERRARAALVYLTSKGIARNRMEAKGYGETQLLNKCKDGVLCTEKEHQQNRRTEFKVLSIQ
jgi:outer membrane protein OmpA-like peptidoglycan-associated protein